ncbi:MAG: hypothetical protein GDA67_12405 [Nitrospira sp. CR1.3]|nr:hypothetical protein [Nitrospira sp. CR1.3]
MNQQDRAAGSYRILAGFVLLAAVAACSSKPAHYESSWPLVPIQNLNTVVGEWRGVVMKERRVLPAGEVTLMIRDNGTYLFVGQTASDTVLGTGTIEVREGRLVGGSDLRTIAGTLHDKKGKALLFVEAANRQTGDRYHGEFSRVE